MVVKPNLDRLEFKTLSVEDIEGLKDMFSREEIIEVIFYCEGDRSPGPDGFNFKFIKRCWSVIGDDIIDFLQDFDKLAKLPKAMTSSFLSLIPKFDNPQGLDDFRPICLIGYLYKVISKILTSRLRRLIGNNFSSNQTTFIPGRHILDGILVTNEIIDYAIR